MSLDSDVVLVGTGVAPLVAAHHLLSQGRSVLLLNPDWDFFLENSELPLDPLLHFDPQGVIPTLIRNQPDNVLEELRPFFPGAVEFWPPRGKKSGEYHDPEAPHVRSRDRLWVGQWDRLEDLFVAAEDAGLNPRILEGLHAKKRVPGASKLGEDEDVRGLLIPRICDVDVSRYRVGLLEFVREKLGADRVLCDVTGLEVTPEGVRFRSKGESSNVRVRDGVLVFCTPRVIPWATAQAEKFDGQAPNPMGVRLWEQWSLISRDLLDPGIVGSLGLSMGELTVWAEVEGSPDVEGQVLNRLEVLRSGGLVSLRILSRPKGDSGWISELSVSALSELCGEFLRWDRFSIRSMFPRAILEWQSTEPWVLSKETPKVRLIPGADGPLLDVVRQSRLASTQLLELEEVST